MERPRQGGAQELAEAIREAAAGKKLRPFSAVTWPLSRERRTAFDLLTAQRPDFEKVKKLLESSEDEPVLLAALHAAKRVPDGEKQGAKKALRALLSSDSLEVRGDAATQLAAMANKRELEKLLNHPTSEVVRLAAQDFVTAQEKKPPEKAGRAEFGRGRFKGFDRMWLLGSRKPLFATPATRELVERLAAVQKISRALKKEFGKKFVGVLVVGSTAKGYFKPASDLDYVVVTSDKKAADRFEEIGRGNGIKLCASYDVDPTFERSPSMKHLFKGVFFGDRKKLAEAQRRFVQQASGDAWSEVIQYVKYHEGDLEKAVKRFGVPSGEREKLRLAAWLLRVPPPLGEMRKIMGVRPAAGQ